MGACAGSTGGGLKAIRIYILYRQAKNELKLYKIYTVRHHRSDGGYEHLSIFYPTTTPDTLEDDKDNIKYVKFDITGERIFTPTFQRHGSHTWWEFRLRDEYGGHATNDQ